MKKLINDPKSVVIEMCQGMVKAFPENLALDEEFMVISRKNPDKNKVNLISGGGSGHEPAHAGFVGKGMLDAAVCGDVFASPSVMQVFNAIKHNHSEQGVLLVIKNYSGDVMNFESAAAMAEDYDIRVDSVCVNDDISIEKKEDRRGVAGTIFVHKIAGALAERGASLRQVKEIAQRVIDNVRTMGIALTSCTVPARGKPTFDLEEDKIEVGVGIHGEAGIFRERLLSAKETAELIIERILGELSVSKEEEVAVLINGFGGTPLQELFILNNEVASLLTNKGITVAKTLVGNYMTSIDMEGGSISVLKLDEQMKRLLSAPCETAAWKETEA
ncbi:MULTISPECIES: dihydroxyacetone kinase subunit DhaK [Mesotoga]|uniref:dihydroxyacetone kinase subunit DhaK n=1 Tax=Mesotoga TaxID=1184396 RepID=UPI0002CBA190|nr:dihydroxyacetone kinase subunit DhaK [Mesotoga prima]CCU84950.1 PTS-dependent dihydroxyacetone kinase,dihydroxyacetone-binding subunit dhaK [Mesotoga infera]HNQ70844.1 dihydroxyacetone kinase subunit DhaK [Mesotoga prima]HNS76164.1 dihydroxyacetone kinase subunit DhaK [Mesotoga prima]HPE54686.1 dihydroxyacetone kinase subunit DhaK [Mesotoga prima]HQC15905.1 dihydroxyacetone kinase subunit DhaK [Mesotoga prima]